MLSAKKSLIIFTRYPEIGKTKTRLIPAIGAEKATDLHRQMTEETLSKVQQLKEFLDLDIRIYFVGGNLDLMKGWLGKQYNYYLQIEGDLGLKMYSAFDDTFIQDNQQVIIIGIDCPQLNYHILQEAFVALNNHDLVIGKAQDGGYYLLGLNQLNKTLFTNINWGTSQVFSQTMAIANKLKWSVYQLPVLRDIDTPEDLKFYQHIDSF
ncbi:TIGR04282 family arsenosugar biosynthesis glycosyltransferase [Geminocystis sp. GBBB08]|uniref:TIGR04282 family arsenosugar biosynthesis glycosyltransferase n=1 Tax=Geminocystis sp. GBBB08 TaxID=2604140 RepID=UPI0027E39039|nr:TIGR04282 family arsenosugar biosynthesis glycosyltransferase [Geminocystis sp. GBBB08]MBL1209714.1 glycosyltransferase [Geminocystis sp. GBBB08]